MLAQGRTVTLQKQLYMLAHCPKPYLVCSCLPSASGSVSNGAAGPSCGMRGCNQDTSRPMQGVGAGESRKRYARRTGAGVQYPLAVAADPETQRHIKLLQCLALG